MLRTVSRFWTLTLRLLYWVITRLQPFVRPLAERGGLGNVVELIVVGLPLSLDGTEGPQAAEVRRMATRLAGFVSTPFEFFDERYSSAAAKRSMAEAGASDRVKRGSVDMVAASLFLQSYLDSHRDARVGG